MQIGWKVYANKSLCKNRNMQRVLSEGSTASEQEGSSESDPIAFHTTPAKSAKGLPKTQTSLNFDYRKWENHEVSLIVKLDEKILDTVRGRFLENGARLQKNWEKLEEKRESYVACVSEKQSCKKPMSVRRQV